MTCKIVFSVEADSAGPILDDNFLEGNCFNYPRVTPRIDKILGVEEGDY